MGKHEFLVYNYSGMENAWLPDRLCGKEEELKSLCWRPRRSLPQSEEASVTAQLYYSESCCPGFYLLFDSLLELCTMGNINTFVCFERQLYCFTSLRLIGQITAYFSVDANTRVHCASWRIFSCSVCVCVCLSVRVIQLCARTIHSAFIEQLGCPRTVAGRPFQ